MGDPLEGTALAKSREPGTLSGVTWATTGALTSSPVDCRGYRNLLIYTDGDASATFTISGAATSAGSYMPLYKVDGGAIMTITAAATSGVHPIANVPSWVKIARSVANKFTTMSGQPTPG